MFVNTITSNGVQYKVRDTETNETLIQLYDSYNTTVNNLNNLYNTVSDQSNLLLEKHQESLEFTNTSIDSLNTQIHDTYDNRLESIEQINDTQSREIEILSNRCDNTDTSIEALTALVTAASRLEISSQSDYENLEKLGTVDNNVLYLIWTPNKLERLYYKGLRMDVIPYEAVDFLISYLENNNYWDNTITSFNFIPNSVKTVGIKISGDSHTNAYIDNSDPLNIKVYAESNQFSISDMNNYFNGYSDLIEVDLGSINNCSNLSNTFKECVNLETLEGTPKSIEGQESDWSNAFYNCQKITEVHCYGTNLNNAFAHCSSLKDIYIDTTATITDVNYLLAVGVDDITNDRVLNIHVHPESFDSFVSLMQSENSHIFGSPYNALEIDKWHTMDNGIYYEDNPVEKLVKIYNNY